MYYLAIDIGASSGRHVLGELREGKLKTEEVYRFSNGMKASFNALTWDIDELFNGVVDGLKACSDLNKIPSFVAIDTWGVDFVLLDKCNEPIQPVYAYRDLRTLGTPEEFDRIISRKELYARTGIQSLNFNSIYQLYVDKKCGRLNEARHFLMIPDFLSYKLTGFIANEYTNATTGSLINARNKDWDYELMGTIGIDPEIFKPLSKPATVLGRFTPEIERLVGFSAEVVHAGSHDTASAVAACPVDDGTVYISSGTWSLIGTENAEPILDFSASEAGFTNEGGIEYRYRFLENVMGMWLFQNIRKDVEKKLSYDEMMRLAKESKYEKLIDLNSQMFLAPPNMSEAIRNYLGEPDLPLEDILKSVYLSLANTYSDAVKTIESLSKKSIDNIFIVGGGSKDAYLNYLTASMTGKRVLTGLKEGTATGNILAQIMYHEKINLDQARQIVRNSISIKETMA